MMAEAVAVLDRESEALREEMEGTRTALADKLGALEQGLMNRFQDATATVNGAVESVQDTVQAVQGAVRDSAKAVGQAFDVSAHMHRHPWLLVGGAVLLGLVAGALVARR